MISPNDKRARLPRCLPKFELADYFSVTTKSLWATILPEPLLYSWGYDQDDVKRLRNFPPNLSRRIYEHYKITDLDADFSAEIRSALAQKSASPASSGS